MAQRAHLCIQRRKRDFFFTAKQRVEIHTLRSTILKSEHYLVNKLINAIIALAKIHNYDAVSKRNIVNL